VLGEQHPNSLTSMNNLASTYRDQGRFERSRGPGAAGDGDEETGFLTRSIPTRGQPRLDGLAPAQI